MADYERPGVYTSYEVSSVIGGKSGGGNVGLAVQSSMVGYSNLNLITSYAAGLGIFGEGSVAGELLRILFLNGASVVKVAAVDPDMGGYASAFSLLAEDEGVSVVVCDSSDAQVHAAMTESFKTASDRCSHRVGVVECSGDVSQMVSAAENLNYERMVMVGPHALDSNGNQAATGALAAAVAGAIVSERNPAIPLNGAELYGLGGVGATFSDGDINTLVRGGVTPVEKSGGAVSIVRGITTRTTTGGAADGTWRELTTVLIVDNVIPAIRDSLRTKFSRTKNTEQTRGAIRTQVVIELENKLANQIIDAYDNVTVTQSADDPTICEVAFEFAVAHGLNQIYLTAHITV